MKEDRIDERNRKEEYSKSIVKGYNVHYMTQEEMEQATAAKAREQVKKPLDDKKNIKEDVTEELQDAGNMDELNPDKVTQEQIAKILGEREEAFQDLLNEYKQT